MCKRDCFEIAKLRILATPLLSYAIQQNVDTNILHIQLLANRRNAMTTRKSANRSARRGAKSISADPVINGSVADYYSVELSVCSARGLILFRRVVCAFAPRKGLSFGDPALDKLRKRLFIEFVFFFF